MKVDIVGGGIAGLSTAISIKKQNKNIDVILHEKNEKIGYNRQARQCGEAHSVQNEWSKWKLKSNCYFTKTNNAEVILGNKKYTGKLESGDGYILNRPEFISQLGQQAKKLEVTIKTNDKIKSIKELDGEIIVDASGCPSSIKRELGLLINRYGIGYQETLINSNCYDPKTLKFEFIPEKGYYWIFPRNPKLNEINIGIGIFSTKKYDLKKMLTDYKKNNLGIRTYS